jgi:hypothetical protein
MPETTETTENVVRVGSPASLLALVPQLLGFAPQMSIVVVGVEPPRGRVRVTSRLDLPDTSGGRAAEQVARLALSVLAADGIKAGVTVGYGPARLVTPVADALRRRAAENGIRLVLVLPVHRVVLLPGRRCPVRRGRPPGHGGIRQRGRATDTG